MKKSTDVIVVSLLLLLSFGAWFMFNLKPLFGFILFASLPLLYLHVRKSLPWKKILLSSLTLGLLLGAFFDLFQSFNHAWIVDLVIPFKILGVLPVDNVLGYFFMTLLVVSMYEYFFQPLTVIATRYYRETSVVGAIVLVVFVVFALQPQLFFLPYSYLVGGSVAALLTIIGIVRHRELLDPALRMAAYFLPVWLLCELTALATGGWTFPGQYLGWVEIQGLGFPFEELFFWMLWYTPFLIVAHSHLLRDKRQ
jgi:hypothetical protein